MLKISLLATCAFTVIMTTFSVIEPLRKEGLAGAQVLNLFWYLAPVMMTLTLPIAMLFAASFVYGRFGMDNELTASKAGGVSTLALMTPAIIAGVIVGVTTLVLSNHVAPELARRSEEMVRQNLKGFIYQKLKSSSSVVIPRTKKVIHADEADLTSGLLRGIVVLDLSDRKAITYHTASVAKVEFEQEEDKIGISIVTVNTTFGETNDNRILELGPIVWGPEYIDSKQVRDKAAFYKWSELLEILGNPRVSREVQRRLDSIYAEMRSGYFAADVAAVINDNRSYELYQQDGYRYVFSAPVAEIGKKGKLILRGRASDGQQYPVHLKVYDSENTLIRTMQSRRADFRVDEISQLNGQEKQIKVLPVLSEVEIVLSPDISDDAIRKKRYPLGLLELPSSVGRVLESVTLEQLYRQNKKLKVYIRDKLRPKVIAEINSRLAYGFGCMLLVPIGAALGLRYRGGHILSAFAISCVPAVILIVLMVMGQQMIKNADANSAIGLAAIWSGVGILMGIMTWLGATTLRN